METLNSLTIQQKVVVGLVIFFAASILFKWAYTYGRDDAKRAMRRLVKKKAGEPIANQFTMQQANDGAMEIALSKRAFKNLRSAPIEGAIVGNKNQMVLRIKVVEGGLL